jgi:hypothetical protein
VNDPIEDRAFKLGQISAYDDALERIKELEAEIRSTRSALVLPTRKPRGGERR